MTQSEPNKAIPPSPTPSSTDIPAEFSDVDIGGGFNDDDINDAFFSVMESSMRITLAGFGGALAGLSFSRRRGPVGAAAAAAARAVGRRAPPRRRGASVAAKPYVDTDLPTTWAVACLSFAGIVEFSRIVSPTSLLMETAERMAASSAGDDGGSSLPNSSTAGGTTETSADNNNASLGSWDARRSAQTVGDYALGGALAGGVFQGSNIRTSAGRRLEAMGRTSSGASSPKKGGLGMKPPTVMPKRGVVSGMIPGLALGVAAGLAQVGIERLQYLTREMEESELASEVEVEDEMLKEVKSLSSAELQRQVEELLAQREQRNLSQTPTKEES